MGKSNREKAFSKLGSPVPEIAKIEKSAEKHNRCNFSISMEKKMMDGAEKVVGSVEMNFYDPVDVGGKEPKQQPLRKEFTSAETLKAEIGSYIDKTFSELLGKKNAEPKKA